VVNRIKLPDVDEGIREGRGRCAHGGCLLDFLGYRGMFCWSWLPRFLGLLCGLLAGSELPFKINRFSEPGRVREGCPTLAIQLLKVGWVVVAAKVYWRLLGFCRC
jgi:hypothetical protein